MTELSPNSILRCFFLLLSLWPGLLVQAQETDNPAKLKLQQEIRLIDELLKETKASQHKSLVELNVLNRQISLRQQLLNILSSEILGLEQAIEETNNLICSMEEDIARIKQQYARTAQLTYQNYDPPHFWLVLLSSGNLIEAYYRAQYFSQFSRFRKDQVGAIQQSKAFLAEKSRLLSLKLVEKEALIIQKKQEMDALKGARTSHTRLYTDLKSEAETFKKKNEQAKTKVKSQIQHTETKRIASSPVVDTKFGQSFSQKKGNIPWPVPQTRGLIVGKYGKTEDPYGNRISNDGIYIRTPQGQQVIAVYQGKVTAVREVPLSGTMVIIEHGDYRTVYANLSVVNVTIGDIVEINQPIGIVRTDNRTQETVLNFLIYKLPSTFLDPEKWIIH